MQPSASDRGAYRSTDTCVGCGKAIDVKTAAYTAEGMICTHCEAGEMLREADRDAMGGSTGVLGALGWGMLSLVCNPFLIPSILAISGGVKELQTLSLVEPEHRASRQVQGIFAIVLGAFWPVLIVGMVGLAMLGGVIGALRSDSYDPYYDDPAYYEPVYDEAVYDDSYYEDSYYDDTRREAGESFEYHEALPVEPPP